MAAVAGHPRQGHFDTRGQSQSRLFQCVIFMTSNLGAAEMSEVINGAMGFVHKPSHLDDSFDSKIDMVAINAARRKFSPSS